MKCEGSNYNGYCAAFFQELCTRAVTRYSFLCVQSCANAVHSAQKGRRQVLLARRQIMARIVALQETGV